MKIDHRLSILAFVSASALPLSGAITLATEDFAYPDGSLITVSSGLWESHSGTAGDLLVSSGQAVVQHGVPSEDAHIQFAAQNSAVLTAAFIITVNDDASPIGGTDYEYFAHFMTEGTFDFRSRLDIQAPSAGGEYTLGISSGSSTAEATLPVDFSFGVPVPVSISFDFGTGTASLTAGGQTVNGTGVFAGESLDSFALRQSDSTSNETILVDNLVISSSIPKTTTALLGALGLLGILRRRR